MIGLVGFYIFVALLCMGIAIGMGERDLFTIVMAGLLWPILLPIGIGMKIGKS